MNRASFVRLGVSVCCSLVLTTASLVAAPFNQKVHVAVHGKGLKAVGKPAATKELHVTIGLPLRNQEELSQLLKDIYNPASTHYHHYLSVADFTERFGPSKEDYQAVVDFAQKHGLKVGEMHANRMLVDVSGPVHAFESAFQTTLKTYQHPTDPRTYFAPDDEPILDLKTAIKGITGLDDYTRARARSHFSPLAQGMNATPDGGLGLNGAYTGLDYRKAYVPDTTLTGTGQVVGLLQYDGYDTNDIAYYIQTNNLPNVPLTNVLLEGFNGTPAYGGQYEVCLDIEMAMSMAPGLAGIIVYEAPNNGNHWDDLLNRMATDNVAKQLSSSWGTTGMGDDPVADQIFQEMAAQGQSFFEASGDGNAYTGAIPFPSDNPYITIVGGTTLTTATNQAWVSETVWHWSSAWGSSGGISQQYSRPGYQSNMDMTASGGSATMRNLPDVALIADNVYGRAAGQDVIFGGTSCAAPLWAGFMALVNEQAATDGRPPAGFINPAIYAICAGSNYSTCFHDTTTGDNLSSLYLPDFYAVSGYDLCTGWGTPAGQSLINALEPRTPAVAVGPQNQTIAVGQNATFNVQATGSQPFSYQWRFNGNALSAATGSALTVTNAQTSNSGSYSVIISNAYGSVTSSVAVLTVLIPPSITTQPVSQVVTSGGNASFVVQASGSATLYYQWTFDGANISGATSSSFTVVNAQLASDGRYAVVVSNAVGTVTSSNAFLFVTTNGCALPPSGLVGWWSSESNALDNLGANNGTPEGGLTFVSGEVGRAFSFNGSNSDVHIQASRSLDVATTGSGLTLEAWVNPADISAPQPLGGWLWANSGIAGVGPQLWMSVGADGQPNPGTLFVNFRDNYGDDNIIASPAGVLTTNTYQHVAMTYDQGTGQAALYVNGIAVAQADLPLPVPYDTSGEVYIGSGTLCFGFPPEFPYSGVFAGKMDEVAIYNRALHTNEIHAIYAAGASGKCAFPPAITRAPWSQTVVVGNTAVFSVIASGNQPMSYQWKFQGSTITGATGSSLVLTNVQTTAAGAYSVVVANSVGSVTSGNATLTVTSTPTAVADPSGMVAWWPGEGDGRDALGLHPLVLEGGITFASGKTGQAFVFNGTNADLHLALPTNWANWDGFTVEAWVKPDTASIGSYQFIFEFDKDPFGSSSAVWDSLTLSLSGAGTGSVDVSTFLNFPAFSSPPGTIVGGAYQHVALTVSGSDRMFRIYVNGQLVASQSAYSFLRTTDFVGGYSDLFFGTSGFGASQTYAGAMDEITVYDRPLGPSEIQAIYNASSADKNPLPPVITSQPQNQNVTVGQSAIFSVTASGTPPLSYQWTFNGANVSGATGTSLTVANAQLSAAGTYAVVVGNAVQSVASSNAVLTIVPPCTNSVSGLVGWWAGEGNAADNTGTNNGAALGGVTFVPGKVGQAFHFRASESTVHIPVSQSLDVAQGPGLTVEAWIKPADISIPRAVVGWAYGPNTILAETGPQLWISSDTNGAASPGTLFANFRDIWGDDSCIVSPPGIITNNTYQHVAVTYDSASGSAALYVNGVVVAQTNVFGMFDTSGDVNIGSGNLVFWFPPEWRDSNPFSGDIDEVCIYDRALNTNEIQGIYAAGGGGKCPLPPFLISAPFAQTSAVGQTAIFGVEAGGGQPLSYQWRFQGNNISGATNSSLVLTNVQLTAAGSYSVVVANAGGSVTSGNAALTVNSNPTTVADPSGMVAWWPGEGSGQDTFGLHPLSPEGGLGYATGKVGNAFTFNGMDADLHMPMPGEWTNWDGFTVETWIKPDSNTFGTPQGIIEFDRFYGSATMDFLTVSISAAAPGSLDVSRFWGFPDFTTGPGLVKPGVYQHVALSFSTIDSRYKLYLNGQLVFSDWYYPNSDEMPNYTGYMGGWSDLYFGFPLLHWWLYLTPGAYSGAMDEIALYNRALNATEIQGIYNAGVVGKQPVAPAMASQPQSQTSGVGQNAVFNVAASGTPPFSYQWAFNGANLAGATNSALVMTNLQLPSAGSYAVVISNSVGTATSTTATLTVNQNPTSDTAPSGMIAWWPGEGNGRDALGLFPLNIVGTGGFEAGVVGQAFKFNGTNNLHLTVPPNWMDWNDFTIEGWIKPDAAHFGTSQPIFEFLSPYNFLSLDISRVGSGSLDLVGWLAPNNFSSSPGTIQAGVYQHVALTVACRDREFSCSDRVFTLYVNGRVVASDSCTGELVFMPETFSTFTDLYFGISPDSKIVGWVSTNYFGALDELTVYSNALSSSEILHLYTVSTHGKTPLPPALTSQPASVTTVKGAAAAFTVSVAGTDPLSYQWKFNGTAITGAKNASLTLSNPQAVDAGTYAVTVTNLSGSVTSQGAVLTVLVPPSITTQPVSQTVLEGNSATFLVTAVGTSPLSYQWKKDGVALQDSWHVLGTQTSQLTIANATAGDDGSYSVLVTNAVGSAVSSNALLLVTGGSSNSCAPVAAGLISWWPAESNGVDIASSNDASVSNVVFTTGIVGQAFSFDGTSAFAHVPYSPNLPNANLTVECWVNPATNNQGPLLAWADMYGSSGLSLWADANGVTADFRPYFYMNAPVTVTSGVFQHIAFTLDGTTGMGTLYWNGVVVQTDNVFEFVNSVNHIGADSSGDLGGLDFWVGMQPQVGIDGGAAPDIVYITNYVYFTGLIDEVSLYNRALSAGEIQSIYSAGSDGKCIPAIPLITAQPASQTAGLGDTATFFVSALGTAPLSYRWTFNGLPISGATSNSYTISSVASGNYGSYSVTITNPAGSVTATPAVLGSP